MFSNSQFIFNDIAAALYRAGLYVSYADKAGGRRARVTEYKAIQTILRILREQNSPESFLHDLAKICRTRHGLGRENKKHRQEGNAPSGTQPKNHTR